jgi:hypothetical protein
MNIKFERLLWTGVILMIGGAAACAVADCREQTLVLNLDVACPQAGFIAPDECPVCEPTAPTVAPEAPEEPCEPIRVIIEPAAHMITLDAFRDGLSASYQPNVFSLFNGKLTPRVGVTYLDDIRKVNYYQKDYWHGWEKTQRSDSDLRINFGVAFAFGKLK